MAAKPEIDSSFRQTEPNETNAAAPGPDNVDTLVSDFLQELTGLSTEIKPVQKYRTEEEQPVQDAPEIELGPPAQEAVPLEIPALKEEVFTDPEIDLPAIEKEIGETLTELERQKGDVIPINDRIAPTPELPPPPAASPKQPVAAPPPQPVAKNPAKRPVRKIEVADWNRVEMFRTEIASSRSSRKRRTFFIFLAVALILGSLIYWLLTAGPPGP